MNRTDNQGFSLVETLVATLILLGVVAGVLALVAPSSGASTMQPHMSDVQQRLRAAAAVLEDDLLHAGAAPYGGPWSGGLTDYVAPVLPHRAGSEAPDPPGTFRSDVVTVLSLAGTSGHSRIDRARADGAPEASVDMSAACGGHRSDAGCGFEPGTRVLLYDARGRWDARTVVDAADLVLRVTGAGALASAYAPGFATELKSRTYYLRHDVASRTAELMRYDGLHTDMPVVEDVVALEFSYRGAPAPPTLVGGLPPDGPRSTYGPLPPRVGQPSGWAWPDGENCTFAVDDGVHVPRLATLVADASGLTRLGAGILTDGPWCPDAAAPDRFDADLLRVRRIDVRLRVQVSAHWLRGPDRSLFAYPGGSPLTVQIPDAEVGFAVSPRNLDLPRAW